MRGEGHYYDVISKPCDVTITMSLAGRTLIFFVANCCLFFLSRTARLFNSAIIFTNKVGDRRKTTRHYDDVIMGDDSVSNHQPHECSLNHSFGRRSKSTSKLRVTGLCVGNSPGTGEFPHKWPVTRKMFPFDDVIMAQGGHRPRDFAPTAKVVSPSLKGHIHVV